MKEQHVHADITVMKFGGASVNGAAKMQEAGEVVAEHMQWGKAVVITSAELGVTDELIALNNETNVSQQDNMIHRLADRHRQTIQGLHLDVQTDTRLQQQLYRNIELLMKRVKSPTGSPADYDWIVSHGERMAVPTLSAAIELNGGASLPYEASQLIVTTPEFGKARALMPQTTERMQKQLLPIVDSHVVPVLGGFHGQRVDTQEIAIFNRGGSDYSAAVTAAALAPRTKEVILWKDTTDGVYDKDPNQHPHTAVFIPEMTYAQATETAANGAKVLHPLTTEPIAHLGIEVFVRKPKASHSGTRIWRGADTSQYAYA